MASNSRVIAPGKRRGVSTKASQQQAEHPLGDYMVPPADPLGRSVELRATVSPTIRRMASEFVAKGLFGFKTEADVMRWCLDNGMGILMKRSKDEDIAGQYNLMSTWVRAASVQMEYMHYDAMFKKIAASIERLIDMGHADRAQLVAEQIWKSVDRLDEPYWKPRFRTMAKKALDRIRKMSGRESE